MYSENLLVSSLCFFKLVILYRYVVALGPLRDTGGGGGYGYSSPRNLSPRGSGGHYAVPPQPPPPPAPLLRGLTPHGTALHPSQLPPLLELAERAAAAAASDVHGTDGADGGYPADADAADAASSWLIPELLRATEDVFSSAGFLVEGFVIPGAAAPAGILNPKAAAAARDDGIIINTNNNNNDNASAGAGVCGLDVESIAAVGMYKLNPVGPVA